MSRATHNQNEAARTTKGSNRAGNSPCHDVMVQGARIKPAMSPAERLLLRARNARKH